MNEPYPERQISNQTATFTKIPNDEPFKQQSSHNLSSIPEEPEPTNLESSLLMPQPLIKRKANDQSDLEFVNKLNKEYAEKAQENMTRQNANITFYPSLANRLLYEQSSLQSLKEQESKLKGQLSGINEMITDLVNKKSDIANEYEEIIKERKCYKRLKKNLEQEYEGYLFMLDGDYCQKLDQETQRQRQVLVKVKKEVHSLNVELSKPTVTFKDVYKDTLPVQQREKEYYDLQMNEEKYITNNKRKQERLALLVEKNREKQAEVKQTSKKIDKLEYERLFQDEDPVQNKHLAHNYEELTKKLAKLKKIKDTNSKVKEMEFYRKVKESKEKELAIVQLDNKIDNLNEKLYKILLEIDQEKELNSKASTYKEKGNTKPKAKRTTSEFRDPKIYKSQKNKLTLPSEYEPRRNHQQSSKNFARLQTEPVDSNDDRPQLLMRRKKIYTQLQRNMYFKNIENSQQEKLSRIHEFDNKDSIAISSYDKFQKDAEKRGLRLPQIQARLKTDGNESIIYNYKSAPQKKLNKRSIQLHNRNMHKLRLNRSSPKHNIPNYHQLCSMLNRDHLLIEQDLQYDLSQLIYSGHS